MDSEMLAVYKVYREPHFEFLGVVALDTATSPASCSRFQLQDSGVLIDITSSSVIVRFTNCSCLFTHNEFLQVDIGNLIRTNSESQLEEG